MILKKLHSKMLSHKLISAFFLIIIDFGCEPQCFEISLMHVQERLSHKYVIALVIYCYTGIGCVLKCSAMHKLTTAQ